MADMTVEQAMRIVEGELAGIITAKRFIPAERRVEFDAQAGNFAEAVDTLRAELDGLRVDAERLDFCDHYGVDWNGMGAYFHMAGSHSGDTLRECVDKARAAIDAARQEKGHE